MNRFEIGGFRRITKRQAKKRFDEGKFVRFVPVGYRPDNYYRYYDVTSLYHSEKYGESFEYANSVLYKYLILHSNDYKCNTGRYLAYYEKVE